MEILLGMADGLDDLAPAEHLALAIPRGDLEVGLAGLAGAVDAAITATHSGMSMPSRPAVTSSAGV